MLQEPHVPLADGEENSENHPGHNQGDRYEKRLSLYRSHQNDCQLRIDQSSTELNEQQNHEISELQKKSKDVKQKRVSKRGIKKQIEINKTKQIAPQSFAPPKSQIFQHQFAIQNHVMNIKQEFPTQLDDLNDIDLKGIENLVMQINQPLTPEVLNFDENNFPYQIMQQFPSSSELPNYSGYFYNPNWTP